MDGTTTNVGRKVAAVLALATAAFGQDVTLEQGDELRDAGDLVGAAMIYEVVAQQEDSGDAWLRVGETFLELGRFDGALDAIRKAELAPETAAKAAWIGAAACARMERTDEAFQWLQRAQGRGYSGIADARTSEHFESLRADRRFAQMLPPMVPDDRLFVEDVRVIHQLVGEAAGDQYGWVARVVGDLDGDGVLDFASTAPSHGSVAQGAGRVYVYSGRTAELLFQLDGRTAGASLGNSVAPAGDVNADGVLDVIAGAPGGGASGTAPGTALVASGKDGSLLLELSAGEAGDSFGIKVCSLGDLDGDGHADVFVGASRADANGTDSGRGYAYSGKTGEELWRIDGEAAGDQFGASADATWDSEHDLLIVGAFTATPRNVGRAYAYRVSAGGAEPFFTIDPDETAANLGQYFTAVAGDVDGDGVPDLYASDWNNAARGPGTGRVYVHSGATGDRVLTLTGPRAGEGFGTSPSTAGDVNGDGRADFIVGAWQSRVGAPSGGACYLHSGADGALLASYTSRQPGATLGFDAVGIGDVDGDGGVDFLLTAAWSPVRGPQTGRTFVVAGPVFEQ